MKMNSNLLDIYREIHRQASYAGLPESIIFEAAAQAHFQRVNGQAPKPITVEEMISRLQALPFEMHQLPVSFETWDGNIPNNPEGDSETKRYFYHLGFHHDTDNGEVSCVIF